jgi:hypothetical protein
MSFFGQLNLVTPGMDASEHSSQALRFRKPQVADQEDHAGTNKEDSNAVDLLFLVFAQFANRLLSPKHS